MCLSPLLTALQQQPGGILLNSNLTTVDPATFLQRLIQLKTEQANTQVLGQQNVKAITVRLEEDENSESNWETPELLLSQPSSPNSIFSFSLLQIKSHHPKYADRNPYVAPLCCKGHKLKIRLPVSLTMGALCWPVRFYTSDNADLALKSRSVVQLKQLCHTKCISVRICCGAEKKCPLIGNKGPAEVKTNQNKSMTIFSDEMSAYYSWFETRFQEISFWCVGANIMCNSFYRGITHWWISVQNTYKMKISL